MPYQTVTLAQYRQQLAEKSESVPFWTASESLNAINETLRLWNLLTGSWKRTQLQITVAGQLVYSFSSSFVYNMRVAWGSLPMELGALTSMNTGRPAWQGETTADGGTVPSRPQVWVPLGLRSLALWPIDSVGGTNLVLDGVCVTPVLVNDTDYIDLAESEFDALLGETVHLLSFKEGGQRFQAMQKFHSEFLVAAAQKNAKLSTSAYFRKALGLDLNRGQKPMGVAPGL